MGIYRGKRNMLLNQWAETGFSGSREGLTPQQHKLLRTIVYSQLIFRAHHGCCIGADLIFHNIVKEEGIRVVAHPPINPSKRAHCIADEVRFPLPYLDRNKELVNESDILIACPNSKDENIRSGTWQTIRYAKLIHRPILIILPAGEIHLL